MPTPICCYLAFGNSSHDFLIHQMVLASRNTDSTRFAILKQNMQKIKSIRITSDRPWQSCVILCHIRQNFTIIIYLREIGLRARVPLHDLKKKKYPINIFQDNLTTRLPRLFYFTKVSDFAVANVSLRIVFWRKSFGAKTFPNISTREQHEACFHVRIKMNASFL